jgi:signal transduction histidine kinase
VYTFANERYELVPFEFGILYRVFIEIFTFFIGLILVDIFENIIFNEINRVESLLLKKGLAIDTSGIDSISCMGDKNWLNILFRNIIDNAIKFSFENNIIKIVVTIHNEMALVSIRDYGTGVSDNELELLTSRFFRSHNIENSTSGSGLGLSICNWIVNKHNGDITFKSHRPGLEVQIMIPIK